MRSSCINPIVVLRQCRCVQNTLQNIANVSTVNTTICTVQYSTAQYSVMHEQYYYASSTVVSYVFVKCNAMWSTGCSVPFSSVSLLYIAIVRKAWMQCSAYQINMWSLPVRTAQFCLPKCSMPLCPVPVVRCTVACFYVALAAQLVYTNACPPLPAAPLHGAPLHALLLCTALLLATPLKAAALRASSLPAATFYVTPFHGMLPMEHHSVLHLCVSCMIACCMIACFTVTGGTSACRRIAWRTITCCIVTCCTVPFHTAVCRTIGSRPLALCLGCSWAVGYIIPLTFLNFVQCRCESYRGVKS